MELSLFFEKVVENWHLFLLFFSIAVLYSSVGFGGGSSYLAILTLTSFSFVEIRAIALLCNIVVVTGNVIRFIKLDYYCWKNIIPLVIFSVPLAFIGGMLRINEKFFFILLGIVLSFSALAMWLSKKHESNKKQLTNPSMQKNSFIGGAIGFISGIAGIGGGIFLAPVLHLTHWDTSKKIAAASSFFILVNSISGFIGQYTNPNFTIDWKFTFLLLLCVSIGGWIGGSLSHKLLSPIRLKKATALLIIYVSIKILWKYL